MDIWGILFQTNPYTVVSIHICYIYMIIYMYIYIYMVIRSVLLFRGSPKFDLVWLQVATSQRPQPTNYCCGQESQKCPTCPFSEYELVLLCSDFRQMIQSPVLHNSSPSKNVRFCRGDAPMAGLYPTHCKSPCREPLVKAHWEPLERAQRSYPGFSDMSVLRHH